MGVLAFDGAGDKVEWSTIAAALAAVPGGAWTIAVGVRFDALTGSDYEGLVYLEDGGAAFLGISKAGADFMFMDDGSLVEFDSGSPGDINPAAATPYLYVFSKAAGTDTPVGRRKTQAGAWTAENGDTTRGNGSTTAADSLVLGTWQDTDDLDGHLAFVAIWNVELSQAQAESCGTNWRTSDLWNAHTTKPLVLIECNVAAASLTNLGTAAISGRSVTGTTLDAAQTFSGWTFDGTGAGTTVSPASLSRTRVLGAPKVSPTVGPAALVRARTLGAPKLNPTLAPASLARARAVGAPDLDATLAPASLARTRAVGSPQANPQLAPASLARARELGGPTVAVGGAAVTPGSLARTRQLGAPAVNPHAAPASLVRARQLGSPAVRPTLAPASLARARAVGAPNVIQLLSPGSLTRPRQVGQPAVAVTATPPSLVRARQLGSPSVQEPPPDLGGDVGVRDHHLHIGRGPR